MLAQILEEAWAISPDPRRDRLAAAFVTHAVALATGVAPVDIASDKRTHKSAARARQIAVYLDVKRYGVSWLAEVPSRAKCLCLRPFFHS